MKKKINRTKKDWSYDNILSVFNQSNINIFRTWGMYDMKKINKGMTFKVEGFKFQGKVKILYDEGQDLYEIYLVDDNRTVVDTIYGVNRYTLVDTIDKCVEKTDNYEEDMDNWAKENYGVDMETLRSMDLMDIYLRCLYNNNINK